MTHQPGAPDGTGAAGDADPQGSADGAADWLDGNAAAGALRTIFAVELTAAMGQCDGCGQRAVMAEARLYTQAPGLVARCAGCDGVLFRVVTSPDRTWLDFRGLRCVEVTL